jgi:hypothetical protein
MPNPLRGALARPRWQLALDAWALIVVAAALWQIVGKVDAYQWDVLVYRWGGGAFAEGRSPCGAIPGQPSYLHFVYPPLVAALFVPLAALKPAAAKLLWLALKLAALAFTSAEREVASDGADPERGEPRLEPRLAVSAA